MTAHRIRMGLAVLFGLGGAFLAAAALRTGTAEANPPTLICSASDSASATGRQYAKVSISTRDPNVCVRQKLGGDAPIGYVDCWSAVKNAGFPCTTIVDIN